MPDYPDNGTNPWVTPATPAVITLEQLAAQLRKFEGQVIHSGAGLAMTVMNGVRADAGRQKAGTA